MALHTQLPIYKAAYELLDLAVDITRSIPRDFKRLLGEKVREECIEIMVLVFRANVCKNKVPHIETMLERIQIVELVLRLARDKRFISNKQYASVIKLTQNIGKQASGWKKSSASAI